MSEKNKYPLDQNLKGLHINNGVLNWWHESYLLGMKAKKKNKILFDLGS